MLLPFFLIKFYYMKRFKYYIAVFNYRWGWFLTNPRKLEQMSKIYRQDYEKAKFNLYG